MIVMHLKTEDVRSGYDEGGGCGGVLGAGWCFVAVKLYYSQKPRLCSDPPPTYNNNKKTTTAHLNMALVKLFTVRELRIKPMCPLYCAMWLQQGTDNVTSVSWQWISAMSLSPQSSVCTVSAPDRQLQRAVFEIFPNTIIFLLHHEHGMSLTTTGWAVRDGAGSIGKGLL